MEHPSDVPVVWVVCLLMMDKIVVFLNPVRWVYRFVSAVADIMRGVC